VTRFGLRGRGGLPAVTVDRQHRLGFYSLLSFVVEALTVSAERAAAVAFGAVMGLDVVPLGAEGVVVVDRLARSGRMPGIYFRHGLPPFVSWFANWFFPGSTGAKPNRVVEAA
jgi:hypothetical protein